MTHEERLKIAEEVKNRVLEKYGDQVVAVAVYGSTAKNEDAAHSDLDMWVTTSRPIEDTRFFVYRNCPVSINWDTEEGRLRSAATVTPFWPIDADELRSYLVLFERGNFMQRLKSAASSLRDEDFLTSAGTLMARLEETANKVRNAREAGNHYRLLHEARSVVWGTAVMLGLLNRQYYPGGRGLYQLSLQMPEQPRDYARLLGVAGGFVQSEDQEVYEAALELWSNLRKLVRAQGIEWEKGELPL